MTSAPADPLTKYYGLREHYRATGKGFDSAVIKTTVIDQFIREKGMKKDDPQLVAVLRQPDEEWPADDERERATRRGDKEHEAEMEEFKRQAQLRIAAEKEALQGGDVMSARQQQLEEENRQLKERLERLEALALAQTDISVQSTTSEPAEKQLKGTYPQGRPSPSWKKEQLLTYAEDQDILVPEELKGQFSPKMKLVDYIEAERERREQESAV